MQNFSPVPEKVSVDQGISEILEKLKINEKDVAQLRLDDLELKGKVLLHFNEVKLHSIGNLTGLLSTSPLMISFVALFLHFRF
jgi:hypothetical protein